MDMRALGNSGIVVAPLGFGGNVFGWTVDEPTAFELLDFFVDSGFNLIDTADVYPKWAPGNQGGESEMIIGKWLKMSGKRDKVVITTKVGMEMGAFRKGLSRFHILRAVEESLTRLQTDYIDLYQSHIDDEDMPLEETLGAYHYLIKQGKVRAIGASNYNVDRLSQALAVSQKYGFPRYESVQTLYNLYDRFDYEGRLEHFCQLRVLGALTYSSLASGFLTGKYRSVQDLLKSVRGQKVQEYMDERGFKILHALDQLALLHHATPAQIALAWLMARPSVTAALASATNVEQLRELMGAVKVQLNPFSIRLLEAASSKIAAAIQ